MMRALCLLLVALFIPIDASAYTVIRRGNGNATIWFQDTVTWTISTNMMADMTPDAIENAAADAFAAWKAVTCATIKFNFGGYKNKDPNNGIHIRFQQNGWDPSVGDALAYSQSDSAFSGKIHSNDVVVNAAEAKWSDNGSWGTNDLQGVLTHEIGHSLGLDHSRDFEATMFFSGGGLSLRTLHPDDEKGLCFLYPAVTFKTGSACDACDKTDNCANGFCWSVGGGHTYCGETCQSNLQCPDGYSCVSLDTQVEKQCWPDNGFCNQAGGNVPLGEFCYGHEICSTGICMVTSEAAFCSQSCNNNSCPPGFSCSSGYCMPAGSKPNGAECDSDNECQSALCISFLLGQSLCTTLCGKNGGNCPSGHQCLDDAVCIPPGGGANGAPCGHHTQCMGTYCTNNKCTQICSGSLPCPAGTSCVAGFCDGSATGGTCDSPQQCPAGMICQTSALNAPGSCQWDCNPLSGLGCPDNQVCKWRWEAWSQSITGTCVAKNGGKLAGQDCSNAPCENDLICDASFGPTPRCRKDCKNDTNNNLGCGTLETCESLEDPLDPLRGLCVGKNEDPPPPPVDTGSPPGEDAGTTPPTGQDAIGGEDGTARGPDQGSGVPFVPGQGTEPADAESGCGSGRVPTTPIAWIALLGLIAWRRRAITSAKHPEG